MAAILTLGVVIANLAALFQQAGANPAPPEITAFFAAVLPSDPAFAGLANPANLSAFQYVIVSALVLTYQARGAIAFAGIALDQLEMTQLLSVAVEWLEANGHSGINWAPILARLIQLFGQPTDTTRNWIVALADSVATHGVNTAVANTVVLSFIRYEIVPNADIHITPVYNYLTAILQPFVDAGDIDACSLERTITQARRRTDIGNNDPTHNVFNLYLTPDENRYEILLLVGTIAGLTPRQIGILIGTITLQIDTEEGARARIRRMTSITEFQRFLLLLWLPIIVMANAYALIAAKQQTAASRTAMFVAMLPPGTVIPGITPAMSNADVLREFTPLVGAHNTQAVIDGHPLGASAEFNFYTPIVGAVAPARAVHIAP